MRENRPAAASRAAYELRNDPVSSDAMWRRRTSFSSGVVERPATTAMERQWSVRQPVLPSTAAIAPLYVVWRRVAGPTCRRPARLRTDTTRLACWVVACLVYGRRLMAAIDCRGNTVANSSEQRHRPDSAETEENRSVFWRTFSSRINNRVCNVRVKFDTCAPT